MCDLRTVFIDVPPVNQFKPPHLGGDREFAGHGPDITIAAHLEHEGSTRLVTFVTMNALETRSDWTAFGGNSERKLVLDCAERFPGWTIRRVIGDSYSSLSFRDADHDVNTLGPSSGNLIQFFTVKGDSNGEGQPWVTAVFNRVAVELMKP